MINNIEESRIIDFLYGEMSETEIVEFQKLIDEHPELKSKIAEIKGVQSIMKSVKDKDVVIPSFVLNKPIKEISSSYWMSQPVRWVGSIAAGVVFVLGVAFVMEFRMSKNEQGLMIGFGELPVAQVSEDTSLTKEEVQSWIKEVLVSYEDHNALKMEQLVADVDDKLKQQSMINERKINVFSKKYTEETNQVMKAYVNQVGSDNKELIENFFKVSTDTQQKYVKNILSDFNKFYQRQRGYDLQVIEASMDLMNNKHEVQQVEQNTLLANLYEMVNTQSK